MTRRFPTTPTSRSPGEARREEGLDLAQELRRALPPPHRHRRGGLQEPLASPRASVSTGASSIRPSPRTPRPSPSALSSRCSRAARSTRARRPPSGTWTFAPPSPRPSSRTASVPPTTTASPSPGLTASATVEIETTRPELLASCVALVAHPDDERYQPLFGTTVVTPLFHVEVPVLAHELADPEKGSGIAMICTFGDTTDVTWWRELSLPTRALIGRDGRFLPADFGAEDWPSRDADGRQRVLRPTRGPHRQPGARDRGGRAARERRAASANCARSRTRSSSTRRASAHSRSSRRASGSCRPSSTARSSWRAANSSSGTPTS